MMKFNHKIIATVCIGVSLISVEITLRLVFGLGSPPLMQSDVETGYLFKPNQTVSRFGNKVEYNQFSQRSGQTSLVKPKGTLRVLMLGDSVLNGGVLTDQDEIISEILKSKLGVSKISAEILNASAGSWGIGNRFGYLRKFGAFQSDIVILQIGTSDLVQSTSTGENIGKTPDTPTHPPILAIEELVWRYGWPRIIDIFNLTLPASKKYFFSTVENKSQEQFENNMSLLRSAIDLVRSERRSVFVLFTPNRDDLVPVYRDLTYKLKFFKILDSLKVPVIDIHAAWSKKSTKEVESYFRDGIHPNVSGNKSIADLIFYKLCISDLKCD